MKVLYIYEFPGALFLKGWSKKILLLVLFYVVKWTIGRSGIYLCHTIVLFPAVFSLFFFLVFNVTIFVISVFRDKKFIVLCRASLPSKTYWKTCSILSVTIVNFSFFLFLSYPQQLKLRGALCRVVQILPNRSILCMISCAHIWTHLPFSKKKTWVPNLSMVLICWSISSSPGIIKRSLSFVTFSDGSGCCSITVWWSLLGLSILIIGFIIVLSTSDRDYFYP